jgi:FGGY-family pentulose kinase
LVTTKNALFVPGIWGPYYSVLLSGVWTNEAGQSASGALIDRVLKGDAAWPELEQDAKALGSTAYEILDARLAELADGKCAVAELTSDLHVQPDFHGNRSPIADPHRKGAIVGLTLETGRDQLAVLYLATIQSLAYGTKHILETFAQHGARFSTIAMSGGLSRNALYRSEHANVTGCEVITTDHSEAVLLGSAIMGAVAAGAAPDFATAMSAMSGRSQKVQPDAAEQGFHDRKYRVFRQMQRDYETYYDLMHGMEK